MKADTLAGQPARDAMDQVREQQHTPELSVIILCYRAEGYIYQLFAAVESEMQRLGVTYEIVLVANYIPDSGDRSPRIVREIMEAHSHVRVVAKPKQGMMGWDMRSGLEAARGRVLALIDGDGQIDPADIGRAYRELHERQLDLCQAYRVKREDGWKRILLSLVYNIIFRMLFPGTGLRDINAKPKVIRRKAYEALRLTSSDWFTDAEIIIQARRNGLRLGEIPTVFRKNVAKPSFINAAAIPEFFKNLILYRMRETREHWRPR